MLFLYMAFARGVEAWECVACGFHLLLIGARRDKAITTHLKEDCRCRT